MYKYENPHGGDIYGKKVKLDFSVNMNPYISEFPEEVLEEGLRAVKQYGEYPDYDSRTLREAIAEFENAKCAAKESSRLAGKPGPVVAHNGSLPAAKCAPNKIHPDDIICGNGASELFMAIAHALKPGCVLIAEPCFSGYEWAFGAAGCHLKRYMMTESSDGLTGSAIDAGRTFTGATHDRRTHVRGHFALDSSFIEQITEEIDLVMLATPNNPTGRLIQKDMLTKIYEACIKNSVILVLDESFIDLAEKTSDSQDISKNAMPKAIIVKSLTKVCGMAGIRLGYMICRDETIRKRVRRCLPEWNVSLPAQRMGAAAARMMARTSYLDDSIEFIRRERNYLQDEFEKLGIKVYPSDTCFLLIRNDRNIYEPLLKKGIMIRKASNFRGLGKDFYRIAVKDHEANSKLQFHLASLLGDPLV